MKCRWLIENFTDSEDYNELIQAVKDNGNDCYVIGRRNNFDFKPENYSEGECVLFQGSIQMTRHCKKVLPKGCSPIAFCTEENFLCSRYYEPLKQYLFNDRHRFATVKELKENVFDFYKEFGKEALIYIRPDRGDKTFSGQLLDLQDFDRFWKNAVVCNSDDNESVIVSTPKTVVGEWRFVCTSTKEILAGSTYSYQGKRTIIPFYPPKAKELVQKVLEVGYTPDYVFCVDVCEDADGNYWLMELTSFSSAGLYATKKSDIVPKVSEIAEMVHKYGYYLAH